MKLKLGREFIDVNQIREVQRIGHRIAHIQFKRGKFIRVVCGVEVPDDAVLSYVGSVEDLIALIDRFKD